MTEPKLHLDMDASRRDLYKALVEAGFDVTRTPNKDIQEDADDEIQLLWATSHQRILFTFNIKDFINLAKKHPFHAGVILANQRATHISQLQIGLSKIMTETTAENWVGQVRWLRDWLR
jgi:hypothetical protein